MEDFLGMFVFIAIYLIAAASGGKKKRQKKAFGARGAKTVFDAQRMAGRTMHDVPPINAQEGAQQSFMHAQTCADSPIHLHDVPDSVLSSAGEGEDPCHAGGRIPGEGNAARTQGGPDAGIDSEDRNEAMQDLLRGVIMSEILTRPCERRAMQRNGRRI